MLDVIARLLLSAGIMVGTTYLPALSRAVSGQPAGTRVATAPAPACPAKPATAGIRALACLG
ncbi:hypothetical protein ACXR8U_17940 [Methylobacterium radiotolerans]|jgi:hypothetical protein|uniref:hypothetical protein n=1 Tax=Methylobacterium TaxID=407 RepID=UPI00041E5AB4|nr:MULTISPECIES: hypothetical protein [Methylobacterium]KZC00407.1 hypothetical protein AU375_03252 [Methylobacterium radiotolerans]MBN6818924.1 hypothetical protein [Methylobacterium organophilum]OXE43050.1 hypothetical protein CCS92_04545 [Methylobacterium radiotolerans]GAN46602.1 hypothetical protein ME121_0607 [Methylobacterium sp. ME121]